MSTTEGNTTNESQITIGSVEYTKTVSRKDSVEIHAYWIVPDILKLYDNAVIKDIDSTITDLNGCNWKLQLGITLQQADDNIGIYFKIIKNNSTFIKQVQLKMFTFDKSSWVYNKELSVVATKVREVGKAYDWNLITKLSVDKQNQYFVLGNNICYLKDGSLHLKYELVVCTEGEDNEDKFVIPTTKLINDMEILYHESMYTDVVIKSADNKEFRVLKAVLSNRSAVLKAHFQHNTTECITNTVESPLDSEVLQQVLLFIYTDEAPKLEQIPEKLLAAADYYQLSRLKALCEKAVFKKLSVKNAIETFQLADLHSANTLKQLTLEFIRRGDEQFKLIQRSQGWAKLQLAEKLQIMFGNISITEED